VRKAILFILAILNAHGLPSVGFARMSSFPQNLGLGISPQVWLSTSRYEYNMLRPIGYAPYLTPVQQARQERIRQARMLFDGRHKDLFLFEGRTQFDFPVVVTNGRQNQLYVPLNMLKLIAQKSADLLFGNSPSVKVEDEIQDTFLQTMIERTALHALLCGEALECAVDGEACLEGVVKDGKVYLKRVDAADIFPVGPLGPDGQYGSYVKYNAKNAGSDQSPDWRLLVTTYLPGEITRELKQLDQNGFIMPRSLSMNEWPQEDLTAEPMEPVTKTGLDTPSIVFIPNLLVRNLPVSDFDGLIELQDSLNAKQTQIARVLAKHSDPKLMLPEDQADAQGNVRTSYDVYYYRNKDEIPAYMTWNAELQSAIADRGEVRDAILMLSETSPILLGIQTGASSRANAFKSIRLEAINSLNKSARKAVLWKAALRLMIALAEKLEQTIPGTRYNLTPLGIEMADGIPTDDDALVQNISVARAAGVMSVKRGVSLQIKDQAAVAEELKNIAADTAAATPTILMGEAGDVPPPSSRAALDTEAKEETTDATPAEVS
jgi:hypothetical protein